jgi:2,4-dienoyl-CoA reductase (NADPH2)
MTDNKSFNKLLEPGYIGKVRTRNRMIKTGTHFGFTGDNTGHMTDSSIAIYERLAKGGIGLLTHSSAWIDLPLGAVPGELGGFRLTEDKFIPSFQRLTDAIHKYDCPAFIQMWHAGPFHRGVLTGLQPVSSSALTKEELPKPDYTPPRALTIPEIHQIVEKFADGALRAKKAGFDGIELNAATTHLLNSFLSRAWNKREDEYGIGNIENRARIVVETIKAVKDKAGKDFALTLAMCGAEYGLAKGTTPAEGREFAKLFEAAGSDALHVRSEYYKRPDKHGDRESVHFPDLVFYPDIDVEPVPEGIDGSRYGVGGWVPLAAGIKKLVSIPVITIGRLDAFIAEDILERGDADFVSLNRRLIADPDYPKKIAVGEIDDIRPCTACFHCFGTVEAGNDVHCRINAAMGKENEYEIKPARKKKKIMIVGAGPSGLEAARVLALRGHNVSIYEKQKWVGGSIPIAAMVKGFDREELPLICTWFYRQLKKLGVEMHLGTTVSRSLVEQVKPDALVMAAGGIHDIPKIPGINSRNVVTSETLHQQVKFALKFARPKMLRRLTKLYMPVGKRVVVMGGRLHGCQTAEFLIKRGRKVTVVETGPEDVIAKGVVELALKPSLLRWLDEKGVKIMSGVRYEEVTSKGLIITDREGNRQLLEADTILTALPLKPNVDFVKSLEGSAPEVYNIGDCREPNLIIDAVADGMKSALAI